MSSLLTSRPKEATSSITLRGGLPESYVNPANKKEGKYPVIESGSTLSGYVTIVIRPGTRLLHQGIFLELVGQIEFKQRNSSTFMDPYILFSQRKDLSSGGYVSSSQEYPFSFQNIDVPYGSYYGSNVRLRYFLRLVSSTPGRWMPFSSEGIPSTVQNLIAHSYTEYVEQCRMEPLKLEVGIDECLHIEFEYNKSLFSLEDVLEGQITFHLARLRVRHMELDIIRMESVSSPDSPTPIVDSETVARYELMDGPPPRHTVIPVRLYLKSNPLTPTFENVQQRFSVRYYLSLVLVDEDDRRYFKKQEITIVRLQGKKKVDTTKVRVQDFMEPKRVELL